MTNFNTTMAAIGGRGAQPAPVDPPARADAAERRRRAATASTRRSRPRARSRARSCPASARRRRRSTPASRGSPRRARCSGRPSSRASSRELQPGDERPREGHRRQRASCCRRSTSQPQCVTRVVLPDRQHQDPGRPALDRRRELQGVLVHDGRPRRRGPELRRQRPVRALPARRRRPDRVARDRRARTPAAPLFGNAIGKPLGTRPALPRPPAAVQPRRRPATRTGCPTSTGRRAARPTGRAP